MPEEEETPQFTDFGPMRDIIRRHKPELAESTISTYLASLKKIYKKLYGVLRPFNKEHCFQDFDKIKEYFKDHNPLVRKREISALIAYYGEGKETFDKIETLKKIMNQDTEAIREDEEQNQGVRSEKQEQNWLTFDEVKEVFDDYYSRTQHFLFNRTKLRNADLSRVMELILLALTTGVFVPPRRTLDWTECMYRGYDKDLDNFVDIKKKQFVFNKYKTAKFYKQQTVAIPAPLLRILKQWIKIIEQREEGDHLLFTTTGAQLSQPRVTQILNRIFRRNISTSMLRHIVATDKYKDVPKLKELEKFAADMGHSLKQNMEYALPDAPK